MLHPSRIQAPSESVGEQLDTKSQLELLLEPLLSNGHGLVEAFAVGADALARGLLAARLAADDGDDGAGPFLGLDALGGEVLWNTWLVLRRANNRV